MKILCNFETAYLLISLLKCKDVIFEGYTFSPRTSITPPPSSSLSFLSPSIEKKVYKFTFSKEYQAVRNMKRSQLFTRLHQHYREPHASL